MPTDQPDLDSPSLRISSQMILDCVKSTIKLTTTELETSIWKSLGAEERGKPLTSEAFAFRMSQQKS